MFCATIVIHFYCMLLREIVIMCQLVLPEQNYGVSHVYSSDLSCGRE